MVGELGAREDGRGPVTGDAGREEGAAQRSIVGLSEGFRLFGG